MVYMTQHSTNALNCILIFSFNCRISFISDDGLRISRNVEWNNVFDYCGRFICHKDQIWAKIFCIHKNMHSRTPMTKATHQQATTASLGQPHTGALI